MMYVILVALLGLVGCKAVDVNVNQATSDEPAVATTLGAAGVTGIVTAGLVMNLDAAVAAGTGAYTNCTATNWKDNSGNANHTPLVNMTSCLAGTSGWSGDGTTANPYALAFDGVDDASMVVSGVGFPTGSSARSITAWVYRHPGNVTNNVSMIFGYGTANTDQYFGIGISNAREFYMGAWDNDLATTQTLSNNTWYHLAVTYSGTGNFSASNIKAYINSSQATLYSPTIRSNQPFSTVGTAYTLGANSASGYELNGEIAGVQLYNRALNAAEVKQNCQADVAKFQGASCP